MTFKAHTRQAAIQEIKSEAQKINNKKEKGKASLFFLSNFVTLSVALETPPLTKADEELTGGKSAYNGFTSSASTSENLCCITLMKETKENQQQMQMFMLMGVSWRDTRRARTHTYHPLLLLEGASSPR